MRIKLSPVERQFFHHLDSYARHLTPPVDCRIAGGWVRDKLLSLPSNDLDVALSIPSGYQFARAFVDHLASLGISTGSVGRVAANPNQSKHLETGTTKILGLECDFVGLRSETYADTRIPTIRPGTPLEDAQRRDLTINALFYNIHTQTVEDFTGQGLDDLAKRVARTPLAARQTFTDDPLRVLRCVRFSARYGLTMDDEVILAIQDEDIRRSLQSKVSRERIGIEITKMLDKAPKASLDHLMSLGLYSTVFGAGKQEQSVLDYAEILEHLDDVESIHWLAAAVSPFGSDAKDVISTYLKLGNDKRDGVLALFKSHLDTSATQRSAIGIMLKAAKPWRRSLVWAKASTIKAQWSGNWDAKAEKIVKQFDDFAKKVEEMGLDVDIEKSPILDGKALQTLLGIGPSRILATILHEVNVWQLDHPSGTTEQCEEWVKNQWTHDWSHRPVAVGRKK